MCIYRSEATRKATSFQVTVESNSAIAIAMPSDWLKNLAPVISTNEKQNHRTLK